MELHSNVKGIKSITPLTSGNFYIELHSAEMLSKALIATNLKLGNIQTQFIIPTDIPTSDVVIHGVPLDEI